MAKGVVYDTRIPGYDGPVVHLLRLWKSEAPESLNSQVFSGGDYYRAIQESLISETVTRVLYPNDEPEVGRRLRLAQQCFSSPVAFRTSSGSTSSSTTSFITFHEGFTIQLNDTHPSIAIAELMRILVDDRRMDWGEAWSIPEKTFSYTNQTLLPEALEKWLVLLLPRPLEIIFEINRRFLDGIRRAYPGDQDRVRRVSIIDESDDK